MDPSFGWDVNKIEVPCWELPPSSHVKEPSVTAHYEHYAHDEGSIGDMLHWLNYPFYRRHTLWEGGCTNKRNIKKIKTIHLEHMLYNYIFAHKSISFKNCKIVSPAIFVNKLNKLSGGRIGPRFIRPRGTSPLKGVNPAGTPGYRNGTDSFFCLKGRPSVVRDV
jgi:hypothetical protein